MRGNRFGRLPEQGNLPSIRMATTREAWEHHEPAYIAVVEPTPTLNGEVSEAVDHGATSLIVDLREAESVGTRGLNVLLDARCRAHGAWRARSPSCSRPGSGELFGLLNLDRRFILAPTAARRSSG